MRSLRSSTPAILLVLLSAGSIVALPFIKPVASWGGWSAVNALSALLAGIGLVFVALGFFTAQRGHSLEQTVFLINLSDRFLEARSNFNEGVRGLWNYEEIPHEMNGEEFESAADALRKCYESTLFLYQIAQLVRSQLVEAETLYLFYYSHISEHPDQRLGILAKWCGTGLDLAGNYSPREVGRMIGPIKELLVKLSRIHEKHGGEPYAYQIEHIEELERDFIPRLDEYEIGSESYRNRLVVIPEDELNLPEEIAREEIPQSLA